MSKKKINQPVYKYFNSVGWENVKIVLLEECYLDNKEQLLREEDKNICMFRDELLCLNNRRAFITAEDKQEYFKEYYDQNKHKITEQQKDYRDQNKDKITEYHKEYNEQNKHKITECNKEYRAKNREKITCLCGGYVTKQ